MLTAPLAGSNSTSIAVHAGPIVKAAVLLEVQVASLLESTTLARRVIPATNTGTSTGFPLSVPVLNTSELAGRGL